MFEINTHQVSRMDGFSNTLSCIIYIYIHAPVGYTNKIGCTLHVLCERERSETSVLYIYVHPMLA